MPRYDYSSLDEAVELGEGVERPFRCHVHGDTNASASVNVEKGVWYCFVCGSSGRVDRKGKTLTTEMKEALALFDASADQVTRPLRWLDVFDSYTTHPYWIERFGEKVAAKFRLGVHPLTGLPCYPIIGPDMRVYGVVQRLGTKPKYLYPAGVPISRMMFGFVKKKVRTVVVVEGACDVIAVSEAMGNVRTMMVVGCYGAGLHLPQVELLNSINPDTVLLGFDSDEAGRRAEARVYPLQAAVGFVSWDGKDPGECSPESIRRAVKRGERNAAGGEESLVAGARSRTA